MSVALEEWRGASSQALDEIEFVLRRVEGPVVGGHVLTQQLNYAYAALILAHFQRYCRAVHTEAANAIVALVPDPSLARILGGLLVESRLLERANPTPGNLSRDFERFGFKLWAAVEADDRRNRKRREKLGQLCEWRNGITHGDVSQKQAAGKLVPSKLDVDTCRDWRRALGALAVSIDKAMARRCQNLGCSKPW
jgi:hypothetical protein